MAFLIMKTMLEIESLNQHFRHFNVIASDKSFRCRNVEMTNCCTLFAILSVKNLLKLKPNQIARKICC